MPSTLPWSLWWRNGRARMFWFILEMISSIWKNISGDGNTHVHFTFSRTLRSSMLNAGKGSDDCAAMLFLWTKNNNNHIHFTLIVARRSSQGAGGRSWLPGAGGVANRVANKSKSHYWLSLVRFSDPVYDWWCSALDGNCSWFPAAADKMLQL